MSIRLRCQRGVIDAQFSIVLVGLCIKGVEIIVYASEYIFRDIYMIARAAEDEISVYAW